MEDQRGGGFGKVNRGGREKGKGRREEVMVTIRISRTGGGDIRDIEHEHGDRLRLRPRRRTEGHRTEDRGQRTEDKGQRQRTDSINNRTECTRRGSVCVCPSTDK